MENLFKIFIVIMFEFTFRNDFTFALSTIPFYKNITNVYKEYIEELRDILGGTDLNRKNKLAIVVLQSQYRERVCCSLQHQEMYLKKHTPSDTLLFYRRIIKTEFEKFDEKCKGVHVHLLPIDESQWKFFQWQPEIDESFVQKRYDYLMMGQWRLLYCFQVLHMLGYKYALQIDDDSLLLSPIPFNLLEFAEAKRIDLGAREVRRDPTKVVKGLGELARYFLISELYNPVGTIWQHCKPRNINGLKTLNSDSGEGWDGAVLKGHFILMRLDFFIQPLVQSFIALCINSGGTVKHRWNEQGTFAMIWQLFVKRNNFFVFNNSHFKYTHAYHKSEKPLCLYTNSTPSMKSNTTTA